MIIATALAKTFEGATIIYNEAEVPVQFGYGDQKELLAWIHDKDIDPTRPDKYPLVWYIINEHTKFDGWYKTEANLYIIQDTQSGWFNPTRQAESYTKIIDPVNDKVEALLTNHPKGWIEVTGDFETRFRILDEPNFGTDRSGTDLKTTNDKGKSVMTDITDARLIRFGLRIKAKCII